VTRTFADSPRLNKHGGQLWIIPAFLLIAPPILLPFVRMMDGTRAGARLVEPFLALLLYGPPAIGILVLLTIIALSVIGVFKLKQPTMRRALWLSCLAIISPAWLFLEWLFLIGFNR